jgi:hypothetical protein
MVSTDIKGIFIDINIHEHDLMSKILEYGDTVTFKFVYEVKI